MNNAPTLGLRQNWKQFTQFVIMNAFVGGMVGHGSLHEIGQR